ncbi:glutaminase [Kitasatospora sp. NPDC056327]|uniref:glutaminase n=1 Tax=Kitasatospora sp. NPDC056327 TaxID=3345785 RepID=UPI0035D8AA02
MAAPPGGADTGPVDLDAALEHVMAEVGPHIGEGEVADYIPDLGRVDPRRFAIAVATVDGRLHTAGDADVPFAIESISKLFALGLVLGAGDGSLWQRVHREPSGEPFNSLVQLEHENGIPRNPFINPGAIVVTDELQSLTGDAYAAVRALLRSETGDPLLHLDGVTESSEARTGNRNRALAYLMADFGNLRNPVPEVLDHYFRQCSVMISCAQLAKAGLLQARHGLKADGTRAYSRDDARRINAITLTCGTYDEAGEFAYRIGLPVKSGVGGGLLAIVPDRCAVATWSPGLDAKGNSVTGALALESFLAVTGLALL